MIAALLRRAVHAGYRASLRGAARRFEAACRDPARAQQERLKAFLAANADTAYGRAQGYARIGSIEDFQRRVPISGYDALAPWVDRIARGESSVLTAEPVRMMERTSGSTAAVNKLIPYTDALRAEIAAAVDAWLHDLLTGLPRLAWGRQYWSVSPVTRARELSEGGLPIGFEDDTEYFDPVTRWALRRILAVPSEVARLPDLDTWRRATLRHLLAAEDLALVSVWSPSFLTLLMEALPPLLDGILAELPTRRAKRIRRGLDRAGRLTGEALWPGLQLISCWTDASAADFVPAMRALFPETRVQGKGLLATEGVISVPLLAHAEGSVLAVTGHFLEFLEVESPDAPPKLAHELKEGGLYSPLLTAGNGFARYHLKDMVRCVGWHEATPRVRFEGRLDRVSDLCGEKLDARQVDRALELARAASGARLGFALVAPVREHPPHYCLFVESDSSDDALAKLRDAMEAALREAHHYRYCRELGQLGPLALERVEGGWRVYERTLTNAGVRAGDIKPTHLDARPVWAEAFRRAPEPREP